MSNFSKWRDRAEMLVPPMPWDRPRWRARGGPTVVLLHGLWRGLHAMDPLARRLADEGFSTLNLPYPSTRLPIPVLAGRIRCEVEKVAADGPVHFITHSLGGILARAMLAESPSWKTGRLIMLAPPNGGSEIVDWSVRHPLIHFLLGPAGRSLGSSGFTRELPPLPKDLEAAVIMGNRSSIPMFRSLLESENDGIVSISRGKMAGLKGFSVVDADHTFIQMHPEAVGLLAEFLKTGSWNSARKMTDI